MAVSTVGTRAVIWSAWMCAERDREQSTVATLSWANLDLQQRELIVTKRNCGRMNLPGDTVWSVRIGTHDLDKA